MRKGKFWRDADGRERQPNCHRKWTLSRVVWGPGLSRLSEFWLFPCHCSLERLVEMSTVPHWINMSHGWTIWVQWGQELKCVAFNCLINKKQWNCLRVKITGMGFSCSFGRNKPKCSTKPQLTDFLTGLEHGYLIPRAHSVIPQIGHNVWFCKVILPPWISPKLLSRDNISRESTARPLSALGGIWEFLPLPLSLSHMWSLTRGEVSPSRGGERGMSKDAFPYNFVFHLLFIVLQSAQRTPGTLRLEHKILTYCK